MQIDLATTLAEIAAELLDQRDETLTVETIVSKALVLVPDASSASITIRVRGRRGFATLGASSDLARDADALQYSLGEGPCLDTARSKEWLRSGHVASDGRWPRWGPGAAELGVGSLLSVALLARGDRVGSLNLYATETGRFVDRDVVEHGLLFAIHAARALASARLLSGLEVAMSSRHTIGLAQGIIMERFGLDVTQAFELLRRISSHTNVRLAELASQVVETGRVPTLDDQSTRRHRATYDD